MNTVFRCPECGAANPRLVDVENEQFVKERDFSPTVIVCQGCLKSFRVPWPPDILAEIAWGKSTG
ncbi:hypothetical protein SY88_00275 [Clostridiales bacterium PH28_bin88]|nr:hypothetical protein SY88_00275 [Clostridiales bacterium PH28_bin88]